MTLDVGYAPIQPVPFSHEVHAGQLGLDCRYCHSSVERSAHAGIPPTSTCMNCHASIGTTVETLDLVRTSFAEGTPIPWIKVHDLPDYAYFDHSAHVAAGVGCASCHGRVDQMGVVTQVQPLSMGWCLDCHRDPTPHLRPPEAVTRMDWVPTDGWMSLGSGQASHPGVFASTDCSTCHR
ncbi:MAG: cytochrome c3 family protein [Candidatus Sumerlaeia bacterium]|nr:cytochrome c3 family protein [Candidatus Sumerlaeia bacterium]